MGLGDLVGKAKDALGNNDDKVIEALEKGGDAVKAKSPDNIDSVVDKVVEAAKDFVEKNDN